MGVEDEREKAFARDFWALAKETWMPWMIKMRAEAKEYGIDEDELKTVFREKFEYPALFDELWRRTSN
jgi:hypothetical protein